MLVAVLAMVACADRAVPPEPPSLTPPAMAQAPAEPAEPLVEASPVREPSLDLGDFEAWRGPDGARHYVGPSGRLIPGSPDWSAFLQSGTPEEVAERLAYTLNRGATVVLSPGEPPNDRIPESEWALVTAPSLSADGQVFAAWMAHPPSFGPFLFEVRLSDGGTTLNRIAAADLRDPSAVRAEQLEALTSDSAWAVKAAAEALGEARVRDAVPRLVTVLSHDWPDARKAAAKALGNIGGAEAIAGLEAAAKTESERGVTLDLLRALDAIGTPEARAALGRVAEAHSDSVVQARARALALRAP